MRMDIANLRQEYRQKALKEQVMSPNPFDPFEQWFSEAKKAGIEEPNAMVLSTVNTLGQPASRIVLLKDLTSKGFVFFTNYDSNKGVEIEKNPLVSLLFPWVALERQLIVKGKAEKIPRLDSESYFHSRPLGSQIGAHVSAQSKKIVDRTILENRRDELTKMYATKEVPLPDNWGGYLIAPLSFEFWQGRPNRLHDRIIYEKKGDKWVRYRLSP